jgi:Protein of unknown function (DUF1572)
MQSLPDTIAAALTERFTTLASRVHELATPLTDEQFWCKPFPFGNSIGHLVLHLTGNLNYYIGAQIARTGYVRNRELEFTDKRHLPKAEVLEEFDRAIKLVLETVGAQSALDWCSFYHAIGAHNVVDRFHMVLRCAAHLDHHVGQMIYLSFEIQRSAT